MEYESGELYIYDRNLKFLGVVDTYSSLRWRRKYFEAGEFELHIQVTEKNLSMFNKDTIVTRQGSTEAGFVKNIEITEGKDNTELVVSGRFLSYFLYRRIVKRKIQFTGKMIDGMKKLLEQMRPFKNLQVEETNLDSPTVTFQCTYKNVYVYIKKLSVASNIGFKIVPDFENKKFIFQNYVGINRTENQKENSFYTFSEEYSNIEKANYLFDSSSLCNYVLIRRRRRRRK